MLGILIYFFVFMILMFASIIDIKEKSIHDVISIIIFLFGIIRVIFNIRLPANSFFLFFFSEFFDLKWSFSRKVCFALSDRILTSLFYMVCIAMPLAIVNLICVKTVGKSKKSEVIGWGDILLLGSLGFFLGSFQVVYVLILAFLTAGIFSAIGLACGRLARDSSIPLVPFITFGMAIIVIPEIFRCFR